MAFVRLALQISLRELLDIDGPQHQPLVTELLQAGRHRKIVGAVHQGSRAKTAEPVANRWSRLPRRAPRKVRRRRRYIRLAVDARLEETVMSCLSVFRNEDIFSCKAANDQRQGPSDKNAKWKPSSKEYNKAHPHPPVLFPTHLTCYYFLHGLPVQGGQFALRIPMHSCGNRSSIRCRYYRSSQMRQRSSSVCLYYPNRLPRIRSHAPGCSSNPSAKDAPGPAPCGHNTQGRNRQRE